MSLHQITSSSQHADDPTIPPARKRSLTWLLPMGLLMGFIGVFALLFGSRLLPATEVTTAPVLTLRTSAEASNQAENNPSSQNPKPKIGRTATKGEMLFQASGWIEPDPYTIYVPALINGIVRTVNVLEGQRVKQGDLLATLIDDDAQLDLNEAETKIKSLDAKIKAHWVGAEIAEVEINAAIKKIEALKALHDDSIDNLTRLEKLPAEAIPEQQVVQARLAKIRRQALVAEAEATIPRLKARIKQIDLERNAMISNLAELRIERDTAQLAMDRTRITSPMDGIILNLHVAPGQKRILNMDDPNSTVIVSIYDPKKLQARIDVPLTEAAGIQIGQLVDLTSDILPDSVFRGKVTRIGGEADLQRNTLQAKVEIINPDPRLRPEMLVRGKFFTTSNANTNGAEPQLGDNGQSKAATGRLALYIPEDALVDNTSVWVVSTKQTAELRKIKLTTETRDGHRRVVEGIKSGEQVILPPYTGLEEGGRVKVLNL